MLREALSTEEGLNFDPSCVGEAYSSMSPFGASFPLLGDRTVASWPYGIGTECCAGIKKQTKGPVQQTLELMEGLLLISAVTRQDS